jgi:hypothetical protein
METVQGRGLRSGNVWAGEWPKETKRAERKISFEVFVEMIFVWPQCAPP